MKHWSFVAVLSPVLLAMLLVGGVQAEFGGTGDRPNDPADNAESAARQAAAWYFSDGLTVNSSDPVYARTQQIIAAAPNPRVLPAAAPALAQEPTTAAPAKPAGPVGAQRMAPTVIKTVGAGGDYATLKAAFDAINSGALTGSVQLDVIGDTTETVTAVLNASGSGSASYTAVLIQPSGGAARTISGSISSNALVTLNGADNVTIDGLNSGGNALTLSNTSTSVLAGTSTLKFIADATNNTVTNASILGSATVNVAAPTEGGNIWFATGAVTGNDNNLISNCNIGPAGANLPARLIWGRGGALDNNNVTISNNNLYDYFIATSTQSRGIDIGLGSADWTISGNRFYQTAPRNAASASYHAAIYVYTDTGNNFQITGNTIGYADSTGAGAYTLTGDLATFYAIYLHVGTTTASSVQGNTIAGISMTNSGNSGQPMNLIYVAAGLVNIGDVTGNTLGGQTGTGSISFSDRRTINSTVSGIYNTATAVRTFRTTPSARSTSPTRRLDRWCSLVSGRIRLQCSSDDNRQ